MALVPVQVGFKRGTVVVIVFKIEKCCLLKLRENNEPLANICFQKEGRVRVRSHCRTYLWLNELDWVSRQTVGLVGNQHTVLKCFNVLGHAPLLPRLYDLQHSGLELEQG